MSILGSNMLAGAAGRARHEIERSLRFNRSESTELNFTPSSAGNQKTWTWSAWIKRSLLNTSGNYQHLFNPLRGGDGSNEAVFRFRDDNTLEIEDSGNTRGQLVTNQVFRDTSAWYHIVFVLDTTQATAANRAKLYVNGEQVTSFSTETYPSQNTTWGWNGAQEHGLGVYNLYDAQYFDGYMAEVNFVDGTALDASYFGETDLETGAWIPSQYNGSYGTNGFYLKFADNSGVTATTLGKDSSGNANNWTPSNFSVTAGAGNDSLFDTPTNNWCTLNSLLGDSLNITSNGNLRVGGTQNNYAVGTIAFPSSGKYYAEATLTTYSSGQVQFGICPTGARSNLGGDATAYLQDGSSTINNASSTSLTSYTQGDVIGIAVDVDNSTVQFYKNNTAQTALTNVLRITEASFFTYLSISSSVINYNFGQQGFKYTPPAGFEALNAKNLPTPTVLDGTKYFNTVLYSGDNSSSRTISGVGFQPDFVWIKNRTDSGPYHILTDVVRGGGKTVFTNDTSAEVTNPGAGYVSGFAADGFDLSSSGTYKTNVNASSKNYVAWNWKAGGAASNNFDGSTTSKVSANPEAGFSIVTYTGTGSETTVGHGLGVTPGMIWVKNRDAGEHWIIDSRLVTGNANGTLHFNSDDEYTGGTNQFGTHSSSIFTVKTSGNINTSGQDYVAYVFSEVEGYSKFGTWTGNGSTNGPFVTCGFKPAFIIWKNSSASYGYNWYIADNARSSSNPVAATLSPILTSSEDTAWGSGIMDFTSNGFKIRRSQDETNRSNDLHFFMAFAEVPFKYANAR